MQMRVIIDRFEEDIAVVELNGEMLNAPRALFGEAKEGDTVELTVLSRQTATQDDTADDGAPSDESISALFKKLRNKRKRRK